MTAVMIDHEQTFPGTPDTVAKVREWVKNLVIHTGSDAEITLCASELATNVILHSMSGAPGGTFTVTVGLSGCAVALTVTDQGPLLIPSQRHPDESGRGLMILTELADQVERRGNSTVCWFDWDWRLM